MFLENCRSTVTRIAHVFQALEHAPSPLPFPIRGVVAAIFVATIRGVVPAIFVATLAGRLTLAGGDFGGCLPAPRCPLPACRLASGLRGGCSGAWDSDEVLELLPQPRSMKSKGPTAHSHSRGAQPGGAWASPAKSPAKSPVKSPSKEKRRHLPPEKWVDYPEDDIGGGQDYQGYSVSAQLLPCVWCIAAVVSDTHKRL